MLTGVVLCHLGLLEGCFKKTRCTDSSLPWHSSTRSCSGQLRTSSLISSRTRMLGLGRLAQRLATSSCQQSPRNTKAPVRSNLYVLHIQDLSRFSTCFVHALHAVHAPCTLRSVHALCTRYTVAIQGLHRVYIFLLRALCRLHTGFRTRFTHGLKRRFCWALHAFCKHLALFHDLSYVFVRILYICPIG